MKQRNSMIKFGGITFIISGILFFIQYLFLLPLPVPPPADADLMFWLSKWRVNIAMADEILFFATLFLLPSIAALYQLLVKVDKIKTFISCGLFIAIIPINIVLDIILGRLVYPVYDLKFSPDIYRLILSIYYGGMHSVTIIMSIATILMCFVIRRVLGKPLAYLGFVVGIFDLIGAYPWLIRSEMIFICQFLYVSWFLILGIRMFGRASLSEFQDGSIID